MEVDCMMGHVLLEHLLSTCQVHWLSAFLAACNTQQLVINSPLPTVLAHHVTHDYEWAGLLLHRGKCAFVSMWARHAIIGRAMHLPSYSFAFDSCAACDAAFRY
jgi:hypothetical protein